MQQSAKNKTILDAGSADDDILKKNFFYYQIKLV